MTFAKVGQTVSFTLLIVEGAVIPSIHFLENQIRNLADTFNYPMTFLNLGEENVSL